MTDRIDEIRARLDATPADSYRLEYTDPAMNGEHWVLRRMNRPGVMVSGFSVGHATGLPEVLCNAPSDLRYLLGRLDAAERVCEMAEDRITADMRGGRELYDAISDWREVRG